MSNMGIKIFFNQTFKTINNENDFQKFKEDCLNAFELNEGETDNYKFYIIKDNRRENITNQSEYSNLVYNNINSIDCVFFEINENEENDNEINDENYEFISLKNELEQLYSILNDYQIQLDNIEEESKSFLQLEEEVKQNFLDYQNEIENQLNNLENQLGSLKISSEINPNISISNYFDNNNINKNENSFSNTIVKKSINKIDSKLNYSCIFIFEKKPFEVNLLNNDKVIIMDLKIKNNGNSIIPQNWNITQFNQNESIFKIKDVDIKKELKVNEEIPIKIKVEIKDENNINFGINSLEIALILNNIGQISKKEVIEINIKRN